MNKEKILKWSERILSFGVFIFTLGVSIFFIGAAEYIWQETSLFIKLGLCSMCAGFAIGFPSYFVYEVYKEKLAKEESE